MERLKGKSKQISILVSFLFLFGCCNKDKRVLPNFEIENYSAYYTTPQFYLQTFKIRSEVNYTVCIVMKNKSGDEINFSGSNFFLLRNRKLYSLSPKEKYNIIKIKPKDSLKIEFRNHILPNKIAASPKIIKSKVTQMLRKIMEESRIVYLTECNDTIEVKKNDIIKFTIYSVQKVPKEIQELRERNMRENWK